MRLVWSRISNSRESGVFLALVAFSGAMYLLSPTFRTGYNARILLLQMTVVAIVALGQTLVMIVGSFDLSQAAVAALVPMMVALSWSSLGLDPIVAVVGGLALGLGLGALNGILASTFRLNPIVMTLATALLFTGINFSVTKGNPVIGLPESLLFFGSGEVAGVPVPVLLMIAAAIGMHVIVTRTLFGRRVLQVGGNLRAAREVGIDVNRVRIAVFAISGLLAGFGGIVAMGRLGSASPQAGTTLLFPVITAVILGGTLLTGGSGSMLGTLMGSAIMAIVVNALVIFDASLGMLDVVSGILVVTALLIDQYRRGEMTLKKMRGLEA